MLIPGKHNATAGTMAGAIEAAFLDQWPLFNPDLPEPEGKQLAAMRLLFVAVAQGVVQHLRDHPDAFAVTVTAADHTHSDGAHTHGDGSHAHSGGSHNHPAAISVISTTETTA
jgi:hypothetical protein